MTPPAVVDRPLETRALSLPFSHLNLRWNPFGSVAPEDLGRLAVIDATQLRQGEVVQYIGEAGRGKTTHLLALRESHPHAVYERIPEGRDRCELNALEAGIFLLDEAQRLRPRRLKRLLARAPTLVLGTHVDLSRFTPRPVRTIQVGGLTRQRLEAIVERRIEWARRGPGPAPRVPREAIEALIARHGDDLRAIEARLYRAFQAMEELGDVQV